MSEREEKLTVKVEDVLRRTDIDGPDGSEDPGFNFLKGHKVKIIEVFPNGSVEFEIKSGDHYPVGGTAGVPERYLTTRYFTKI